MKSTMQSDLRFADELASLLAKGFMQLVEFEDDVKPRKGIELAVRISGVINGVLRLFYLSEEELLLSEEDRPVLLARQASWYREIVADYPGGEKGLVRMSLRFARIYGALQGGRGITNREVCYLIDRFSLIESHCHEFSKNFTEELDFFLEQWTKDNRREQDFEEVVEVVEAEEAIEHQLVVKKLAPDAEPFPGEVMIYMAFVDQNTRHVHLFDPVDLDNFLMLTDLPVLFDGKDREMSLDMVLMYALAQLENVLELEEVPPDYIRVMVDESDRDHWEQVFRVIYNMLNNIFGTVHVQFSTDVKSHEQDGEEMIDPESS